MEFDGVFRVVRTHCQVLRRKVSADKSYVFSQTCKIEFDCIRVDILTKIGKKGKNGDKTPFLFLKRPFLVKLLTNILKKCMIRTKFSLRSFNGKNY